MKISLKGVLQYFFIFSEGLVVWGEHGLFYILGDIQDGLLDTIKELCKDLEQYHQQKLVLLF